MEEREEAWKYLLKTKWDDNILTRSGESKTKIRKSKRRKNGFLGGKNSTMEL